MKHLQRELEALSTMTTNETGNPAAIATSLTAGEREALRAMPLDFCAKRGSELWDVWEKHKPFVKSLLDKKLIRPTLTNYKTLDLGKRVLAALETPAAADARPTAITVKQYVDDRWENRGYLFYLKENHGDHISSIKRLQPDYYVIECEGRTGDYEKYVVGRYEIEAVPIPILEADTTVPAQPAQPAPDNGGGDDVDWQARALKAEADLASVYSTAEHMNSETHDNYTAIWKLVTSNIGDWDYPAQVIRHVGHMVDDLAAANAALAAARERLARVEGALRYYANKDLYLAVVTTYKTGEYDLDCPLLYEGGETAREALEQAASALAQDAAEGGAM